MNMSPAGLPGLLVVIVGAIGMWYLFGGFFLAGLGVAAVVAVVMALAMRGWRTNHPSEHSLLHLDSDPINTKAKDANPRPYVDRRTP
jgi:hypothetical protein